MVTMLETIISSLISTITLVIAYIYTQRMIKNTVENIKRELKLELETWLNSENGQKAIYSIGAIIGNGAKSGFGLQTKGGKFKWQDLVGQIASQYIQQKFIPQQRFPRGAESTPSTSLNIE